MNTNQTNTLVVKHYDNTYQICTDLGAYVRANAPDDKARDKVRRILVEHSDLPYARALLCYLHGAFDGMSERSWDKAVDDNDAGAYVKHLPRSAFYRRIADWAKACYDRVKEAPVIKDAEDDSDPYVKPSPKADPMERARAALIERLTAADFGKRRIDLAAALFKSVVLERPVGATVLDILERFGDEASELSWNGEYDAARFWDACVTISDALRSNLAADQLKKASTITVPDMMWEVDGDPDRAPYRTRMQATHAALKLFPDETPARRDLRLRSSTVKP